MASKGEEDAGRQLAAGAKEVRSTFDGDAGPSPAPGTGWKADRGKSRRTLNKVLITRIPAGSYRML